MANIEGNVTVGYNVDQIGAAMEKIMLDYADIVAKSEEFKEPVVKAIDACWHGESSVKFIEELEKKIAAQNLALKEFFLALTDEEKGLLPALKKEWIRFESEGIQFVDGK